MKRELFTNVQAIGNILEKQNIYKKQKQKKKNKYISQGNKSKNNHWAHELHKE